MYRVYLYDNLGTDTASLLFARAKVHGWSKRINAPGKLIFSLPFGDTQATPANLRKYRRIRLFRRPRAGGAFVPVWYGYISSHKRTGQDEITVYCEGMLQFFTKRFTAVDENMNGQGSTEAFGLLTATNLGDGDTGIVSGDDGVTSTRDLTMQGAVDILRAWELLAQAHDAEFEIDDGGAFNFVSALGEDKSSTITLTFRRDGTPGTNVADIEEGEDGEPMANKVIATSGGLTSTQQVMDPTPYPRLIERRAINEAQDQTTLDSMASALLAQLQNPITDFRAIPLLATKKFNVSSGQRVMTGLDYADVSIGDLVTTDIITENQSMAVAKRVAEIVVETDEQANERIRYTLSQSGVFLTAAILDLDQARQIRRRIRELEAVV